MTLPFALLLALAPADTARAPAPAALAGFGVSGYAAANYFAFDWDTDPARRNAIDLERLVVYPTYRFSEKLLAKAEIEFEHGGTGATLEFDVFEEFGEFEQEIEKGGEVLLEQLHLDYRFAPWLGVRAGRVKLPIGLASVNDEPTEYFTTTRSEAEASLLPSNWYENGVQAYGLFGGERFAYTVSVVNGLDGTGFSSAHWVQRGHQTRFETVNADAFAVAGRLDVFWGDDRFAGVSGYVGNSTPNRPRPDLQADAYVGVVDAHAQWAEGPVTLRGLALYGYLQNADAVSQANRNLPNALGVVRTPVGSSAVALVAEAGYDVLALVALPGHRLDVFGRYEFYDSMASVTGDVFDNPRWERTAYTGGLAYRPLAPVVLKAQFTHRRIGLETENVENTFSAGLGFEF
jgi:hypothetical protein